MGSPYGSSNEEIPVPAVVFKKVEEAVNQQDIVIGDPNTPPC